MDDSIPKPDDLDNNNFDFVEASGPGEAAAAFTLKQPRVEQAQGGGGREQQARQGRATEQAKLRPRTERGWAPQLDRETMLEDPARANLAHNENLAYMAGVRLHEADRTVTQRVGESGVTTQTVADRANIRAADLVRTVSSEYHEAVDAKSSSDSDSSYTDRRTYADGVMRARYDELSKRHTKSRTDERLAEVRGELVRTQAETSQPTGTMTAAEVAAARAQHQKLNVSTGGRSQPTEANPVDDYKKPWSNERERLAWMRENIDPLAKLDDIGEFRAQFTDTMRAGLVASLDEGIQDLIAVKKNPDTRYPGSVGSIMGFELARRIILASGNPDKIDVNNPSAIRSLKFKGFAEKYLDFKVPANYDQNYS
jgi:hypothetical protein